jgi:hypothetical protein
MGVRGHMKRGRHVFTIEQLSRLAGIDPSNVSRGLDRLASLEIIGRRSTRGRLGKTVTWALKPRTSPALRRRSNVATTTSFGGYLTRERWLSDVKRGEDRAVRRLSPPRVLYGRCAAGHRCRLGRWKWTRIPSTDPTVARSFDGEWRGRCGRCGEHVRLTERVAVPATDHRSWERAGDIAGRLAGGAPWASYLPSERSSESPSPGSPAPSLLPDSGAVATVPPTVIAAAKTVDGRP